MPGTYTELTPAAFNAIATAADLRAQYDVLLFAYDSDGSVDASWARLRAYLALGGGIVFEDPNNVGDLADILTGAADNLSGSGIALLPVPALTDGIANSFTNSHISFTAWSDSLAHFVLRDTKALGLYGRFGSGCIVVTGTDQAKDGSRGAADPAGNQYNFLLKEVLFAANCPLNATPGTVASVRIFPKSVTFTDAGQQAQLRGTALDEAGTPVVGAPITWTSLNPDVATVDASSGLVTSVRNGQAAIQAEGSGADYALAGAAQPSSVILNAWGTEVAANLLSTSYLLKIWASSADNLVAVGDGGRIVRFNGVDWDALDGGNPNWLWGVWGSSATDVYAVGNNGTLLHSTGGAFTALPDPSSGSAHFYGVWGSGPNDVFIVGSGGVIYHFDGTNWAQMVSNTSNALQS
ncbi:MAG: Ig-like domain-containing protein, partial [Gemmatimonadetes bacterium]|nr:Ig-like domain-containing protein [Gemmatimonadota bacterium]